MQFDEKPSWLNTLEKSECFKNIRTKLYQIATTILYAVISNIQTNTAPGIDRITRFWYKSLHSYRHELELIFNKPFNELIDTPD